MTVIAAPPATPAIVAPNPPAAPAATAAPVQAPAVESASTNATTAAPPAAPAAGAPAPPAASVPSIDAARAEINALAEQFGFDPVEFAQFNDAATARAAIRQHTEQTAQQGMGVAMGPALQPVMQPTMQPAVQPPAPAAAPVAVKPIDLKAFGLEDDDPAAKALRAIEAQNAELRQQVTAIQSEVDATKRANAEAAKQQLQAVAMQTVDGFADPKYGVGNQRTASQKVALARLYDLADAIAIGEYQAGRPITPVAARLARARLVDSMDANAPTPAAPAAPAVALPQTGPAPAPAAPMMTNTERWKDNPELKRVLGIK